MSLCMQKHIADSNLPVYGLSRLTGFDVLPMQLMWQAALGSCLLVGHWLWDLSWPRKLSRSCSASNSSQILLKHIAVMQFVHPLTFNCWWKFNRAFHYFELCRPLHNKSRHCTSFQWHILRQSRSFLIVFPLISTNIVELEKPWLIGTVTKLGRHVSVVRWTFVPSLRWGPTYSKANSSQRLRGVYALRRAIVSAETSKLPSMILPLNPSLWILHLP